MKAPKAVVLGPGRKVKRTSSVLRRPGFWRVDGRWVHRSTIVVDGKDAELVFYVHGTTVPLLGVVDHKKDRGDFDRMHRWTGGWQKAGIELGRRGAFVMGAGALIGLLILGNGLIGGS